MPSVRYWGALDAPRLRWRAARWLRTWKAGGLECGGATDLIVGVVGFLPSTLIWRRSLSDSSAESITTIRFSSE